MDAARGVDGAAIGSGSVHGPMCGARRPLLRRPGVGCVGGGKHGQLVVAGRVRGVQGCGSRGDLLGCIRVLRVPPRKRVTRRSIAWRSVADTSDLPAGYGARLHVRQARRRLPYGHLTRSGRLARHSRTPPLRAPGVTPARAVNSPWKPATSRPSDCLPGRERRTVPAPGAVRVDRTRRLTPRRPAAPPPRRPASFRAPALKAGGLLVPAASRHARPECLAQVCCCFMSGPGGPRRTPGAFRHFRP